MGKAKFPMIFASKGGNEQYSGNYSFGQTFHGFGVYTCKKKGRFYGMFENGKKNGKGIVICDTGFSLNGVWDGENVSGKSTFYLPNFGKLVGNFNGNYQGTMDVKGQLSNTILIFLF